MLKVASQNGDVRRYREKQPLELSNLEALVNKVYGSSYELSFVGSDGHPCTLTAESFEDFLAQASISLSGNSVPTYRLNLQPTTIWQVNLGWKGWKDFEEPLLSQLREARAVGSELVSLRHESCDEIWEYEVDFQAMTQRNLKTSTVRSIRELCISELQMEKAKWFSASVRKLTSLWIGVLSQSPSKAIALECRTSGGIVHVKDNGGLDIYGSSIARTTFVSRTVGEVDGRPVITLCSVDNMGYLVQSETDSSALKCCNDESRSPARFEVLPCWWGTEYGQSAFISATRRLRHARSTTIGSALRLVSTGQFVDVSAEGNLLLMDAVANEDGAEQSAELFLFRYRPDSDVAWKEDGQYEGRRLWNLSKDHGAYTFPEFVDYVHKNETKLEPFGETGITAAKFMWALAAPEGASQEELAKARAFAQAVEERRCWSQAGTNPTAFSFSQCLTWIEARGLRHQDKTDIETARAKWERKWQW